MKHFFEQTVQRYLELTGQTPDTLRHVTTPSIDDHQIKPEDFEVEGQLAEVAAQIVLNKLYLARIGRPDLLWSVNILARAVTKWTKACDKRLHRLISYINCTLENVQICYVGYKAADCKLALFCDASFAGDLKDSKSTSVAILCLVGSRTFVPISWF